ncbi:MAG: NADH-quinone oxidoreductase subunit M [Actinomycetota bacterium]|nr:NADH-quinone oxidoreductase subunit M [Actinomycetota bacterium]
MPGGFPWLSATVFLPLAGAAVMLALPALGLRRRPAGFSTEGTEGDRREDDLWRWWALAVSTATFVVSLGVLGAFDGAEAGFQLVERVTWVEDLNFQYALGVDGISLFMVLLTTFLMPLAILASWNVERSVPAYMAAMLVLETAVLGAFVATDLLLFFVFFEALLVPMYLIIGAWGGPRRIYAAVKFFLFTMAGSAFLLVAILFLYFRAGSELGEPSFDLAVLGGLDLPVVTGRWLFLAFFVAFAVKVPLFPLHTWLPDAHVEAPTAGSVILAGVLLKIGAYGLVRFNLSLFPEASVYFRDLVMTLAVIGIVYGAVVALIQVDVKRLVAYSSVSHLGFIVLGVFAGTAQGMSGGVIQMVNHGLSTGALFLLVGMLYDRTHTRDLDAMGGLARRVPVLAGVFLVVALSSLALPGLNGFVGEFLILVGAFVPHGPFAVVATTGVVLSAIYLLWAYRRSMHGDLRPEHEGLADLSLRERAILVPVVAAIVAIGVYPKPLLERIEPAAGRAVSEIRVDGRPVQAAGGG